MDARELRIGNLISLNWNGLIDKEVLPILEINEKLITTEHNGITLTSRIEDVKPIPLTEEWLVKFGFRKIMGGYYKQAGYKIIIWPTMQITFEYMENELREIKAIHELQNLYFALTGKELEIK